jgi:AbrB family looped-hinge helix DNA binding protein
MQQLVSITRQGQITIPASFRRLLGLDRYSKAAVRTENNKIIIEPVPDILSLGGIIRKKAIKRKNIEEIIRIEKKAISQVVSKNYHKK